MHEYFEANDVEGFGAMTVRMCGPQGVGSPWWVWPELAKKVTRFLPDGEMPTGCAAMFSIVRPARRQSNDPIKCHIICNGPDGHDAVTKDWVQALLNEHRVAVPVGWALHVDHMHAGGFRIGAHDMRNYELEVSDV